MEKSAAWLLLLLGSEIVETEEMLLQFLHVVDGGGWRRPLEDIILCIVEIPLVFQLGLFDLNAHPFLLERLLINWRIDMHISDVFLVRVLIHRAHAILDRVRGRFFVADAVAGVNVGRGGR
jgi:hypothetical protein